MTRPPRPKIVAMTPESTCAVVVCCSKTAYVPLAIRPPSLTQATRPAVQTTVPTGSRQRRSLLTKFATPPRVAFTSFRRWLTPKSGWEVEHRRDWLGATGSDGCSSRQRQTLVAKPQEGVNFGPSLPRQLSRDPRTALAKPSPPWAMPGPKVYPHRPNFANTMGLLAKHHCLDRCRLSTALVL